MIKNYKISHGGLCCIILIVISTMNCFASRQINSDELKHTHITCRQSNRYDNDKLKHTHVMDHTSNRYDNERLKHTHIMDHSSNRCDDERLKHTHVMDRPLNSCTILQPSVVIDHKNPMEVDHNQIMTDGCSDNGSTFDEDHFEKDSENIPQEPRYVSFFIGCKIRDIIDAPENAKVASSENAEIASLSLFNKLGTL